MKYIAKRQAVCLIIMYQLGSTIIFLGSHGHHAWQSILCGYILVLPILFVYSYLLKKHPGKNLFQINTLILPKGISHIVNFLYVILSLYIGSRAIFKYSDFITTTALSTDTTNFFLGASIIIIGILILKKNLKTLIRFSQSCAFLGLAFIIFLLVVGLEEVDMGQIFPIIPYHKAEFVKNTLYYSIHPFGECLLLLNIFCFIKEPQVQKKSFFYGNFLSCLILLYLTIRILARVGDNLSLMLNYPLYTAVSLIKYKDFISGLEALSVIVYFFTSFIKFIVCAVSILAGLEELFKIDGKKVAVPVMILLYEVSKIVYSNQEEINYFTGYYGVFAGILLFLVPLTLALIALFKNRRDKKNKMLKIST